MGRKFINKKSEKRDDGSEWEHITEISPKMDVNDILDIQDRTIFFDKDQAESKTTWEKTKEEVRNAMDRAGNVGQYIKYVNAHIEKQNSEINKIKKTKSAWEDEVKLLKNNTSEPYFIKNIPILNKKRMIELRDAIIEERNHKKYYLNKLRDDVCKIEQDLEQKQKEIEQLEINIKNLTDDEDIETQKIRDELLEIAKKYDAETIAEIIKKVEQS